ncbi:MAG: hypothetical protein ACYCZB_12470 [Acidiphilium sp.]
MHNVIVNNGGFGSALVPIGVVFMVFVVPTWLVLHYLRGGMGKAERERLEAGMAGLAATAQRLEARVAQLERALLDHETAYDPQPGISRSQAP